MLTCFRCSVFCFLLEITYATDIAAIYGHDIFIIEDVHRTLLDFEANYNFKSLTTFEYPTALTYDFTGSKIFIADANNEDAEIFSFFFNKERKIRMPIISRAKQSLVDAITYDPVDELLIWTDSYKHGIYSIDLLNSNSSYKPSVIAASKVIKPRGITIDFCNRDIYWTERDDSRPSIKKYNLIDKKVEIFKNAKPGFLYQGLYYDFQNNELIWAETFGDDERNSSCSIIQKSLLSGEEFIIGSFENCYPFAITSDETNVYWSDWGRKGIMKLSRKKNDLEKLVKLLSTPPLQTDEGHHNGAFGIANVGNDIGTKMNEMCMLRANQTKSFKTQNEKLKNPSDSQNRNSTSKSSIQIVSNNKEFDFNYSQKIHRMRLIIIFLVCGCSFMFSIILYLIIRNLMSSRCMKSVQMFWVSNIRKRISTLPGKPKMRRRFKHKAKTSSSSSSKGILCVKEDGIKIDIEDCCQMTVCETPCFTSIKKDGKGYKKASKTSGVDDKEGLLCNLEDV